MEFLPKVVAWLRFASTSHMLTQNHANSLSNSVYTHLTGWLPFGTPWFGTGFSYLVANCTTSCVWWTSLSSVTTRRAGTTAWSWRWWLGCVVPGGGPLLHSKGMPWLKTILFLLTDHDKICGTERADEQIVTKKTWLVARLNHQCPCGYAKVRRSPVHAKLLKLAQDGSSGRSYVGVGQDVLNVRRRRCRAYRRWSGTRAELWHTDSSQDGINSKWCIWIHPQWSEWCAFPCFGLVINLLKFEWLSGIA